MGKTYHKKRGFVAVGAVMAVFLALAAAAYAAQPNIFGGPGAQPKLNANCSRAEMFITPAGKVWNAPTGHTGKKYVFAISTVMGGQIKCLIHRVDKLSKLTVPGPKPDTCFAQAGPVPATAEAKADKQGYHDTRGLNALDAWAKKLALCEAAEVTLVQVMNLILAALNHAGAHHPSFGAVSQHLGWVETKHWWIKVCYRGTKGCGF